MASITICEVTEVPSRYKILTRDDIWEVFPGRHNLFHTIILFLIYVERYQSGYLGYVTIDTNLHS
jgi:hypothetical protein